MPCKKIFCTLMLFTSILAILPLTTAISYSSTYPSSIYMTPRQSYVIVPEAGTPYYSQTHNPYRPGTIYLATKTVEPLHEEKTMRTESQTLRETPRERFVSTTSNERDTVTHRDANGYSYTTTSTQKTSYQRTDTSPSRPVMVRNPSGALYRMPLEGNSPSHWRYQPVYTSMSYAVGDNYTTPYYYMPRAAGDGSYDWRY